MKKKTSTTAFLLVSLLLILNLGAIATDISGTINTYWSVTGINTAGTEITIGSTSQGSSHTLTACDWVLIIQMNGATVDQTNNSTSGDITAYNDAGHYEFGIVQSISGQTVTLVNALTNTFTVSASSQVQLIWVPQYQDATVPTGSFLLPSHWDESQGVGGVPVFTACHLTINGDISSNAAGFEGGGYLNYTLDNDDVDCNFTDFIYTDENGGGMKGKGIGFVTDNYGRGNSANGGGGGDSHNSGGAGGSNAGYGGNGGDQLYLLHSGCLENTSFANGGEQTPPLTTGASRIFMGGGGGAGHADDGGTAATAWGGQGGGIIIIKAGTITGSGNIAANGRTAQTDVDVNGGGGGGAGGTILLDVGTYTSYTGSVTANGGWGANITGDFYGHTSGPIDQAHGPGGGGGGGVIGFSGSPAPAISYYVARGFAGHSNTFVDHGQGDGHDGTHFLNLNLDISLCPEITVNSACSGSPITLTPTFRSAGVCSTYIEIHDDQDPANWYYLQPGGWVSYTTGQTYDLSVLNLPCGHKYTVKVATMICETGCGWVEETKDFYVYCNPTATLTDNDGHSGYLGCNTTINIPLTSTVTGGTGPFEYHWGIPADDDGDPGLFFGFSDNAILIEHNAVAGDYCVTVTDANDCSASACYHNYLQNCCDPRYTEDPYVHITPIWIGTEIITHGYIIFPPKCFITEMLTIPTGIPVNINNCEVVFYGHTSGITFADYSEVDAQNSEFKPCDPTDWWQGLIFESELLPSGDKGVIHECVFTNAQVAVMVRPNVVDNTVEQAQLDMVNNEFFDCQISIGLLWVNFNGSIAGNAFHKTSRSPVYELNYGITCSISNLTIPKAILMWNSNISKAITDNRFTNDVPEDAVPYEGILNYVSSAVITNNEFTNMYRCLSLKNNPDPVIFQNNDIQYAANYHVTNDLVGHCRDTYGVLIYSNDAEVAIGSNEIACLTNDLSPDKFAIYADAATNVIIEDNKISGFTDAIEIVNGSSQVYILRNTISNFVRNGIASVGIDQLLNSMSCSDIYAYWNDITTTRYFGEEDPLNAGLWLPMTGILLDNTFPYFVYYNYINMEGIEKDFANYPGLLGTTFSNSVGIELRTNGHHSSYLFDNIDAAIVENCIHETRVAINFVQLSDCPDISTTCHPCRIPFIGNNYMYNYIHAGIAFDESPFVIGGSYYGPIGSTNAATGSGRNMFVSNYLATTPPWGAAVDVAGPNCGGLIGLCGNSSNLVSMGNVMQCSDGNTITSTASCGNYVGNAEIEVGGRKVDPTLFNFFFQKEYEKEYPITLEGDNYEFVSGYETKMNKVEPSNRLSYVKFLYGILNNNETMSEADKLEQFANRNNYLTANDRFYFSYFVATEKQDWQTAENLLGTFAPSSNDEQDFVTVQRMELAINQGQKDPLHLSEADRTLLAEIDDKRGKYAAEARSILNTTTDAHDFIFIKIPDGTNNHKLNGAGLGDQSFLQIYPNPAEDKVNVKYFIHDKVENAELNIVNMLGEKMVTLPLHSIAADVEVSLPGIPTSVYVVEVKNNGKKVNSGKLVIK